VIFCGVGAFIAATTEALVRLQASRTPQAREALDDAAARVQVIGRIQLVPGVAAEPAAREQALASVSPALRRPRTAAAPACTWCGRWRRNWVATSKSWRPSPARPSA
jgi:hypothetical protein